MNVTFRIETDLGLVASYDPWGGLLTIDEPAETSLEELDELVRTLRTIEKAHNGERR